MLAKKLYKQPKRKKNIYRPNSRRVKTIGVLLSKIIHTIFKTHISQAHTYNYAHIPTHTHTYTHLYTPTHTKLTIIKYRDLWKFFFKVALANSAQRKTKLSSTEMKNFRTFILLSAHQTNVNG